MLLQTTLEDTCGRARFDVSPAEPRTPGVRFGAQVMRPPRGHSETILGSVVRVVIPRHEPAEESRARQTLTTGSPLNAT